MTTDGSASTEQLFRPCYGIGDKDQEFTWLGKACEDHSEWFSEIRVDPAFDTLRSDPRHDALIQRMNITL